MRKRRNDLPSVQRHWTGVWEEKAILEGLQPIGSPSIWLHRTRCFNDRGRNADSMRKAQARPGFLGPTEVYHGTSYAYIFFLRPTRGQLVLPAWQQPNAQRPKNFLGGEDRLQHRKGFNSVGLLGSLAPKQFAHQAGKPENPPVKTGNDVTRCNRGRPAHCEAMGFGRCGFLTHSRMRDHLFANRGLPASQCGPLPAQAATDWKCYVPVKEISRLLVLLRCGSLMWFWNIWYLDSRRTKK